jgi:hypothetical protein
VRAASSSLAGTSSGGPGVSVGAYAAVCGEAASAAAAAAPAPDGTTASSASTAAVDNGHRLTARCIRNVAPTLAWCIAALPFRLVVACIDDTSGGVVL